VNEMRVVPWLLVLVAPVFLGAAQSEQEAKQKRLTIGSSLFRTNCASCHGVDGKGEGPVADQLKFAPSDLTTIARRNGGEFPLDEMRRMIDGRMSVKGHGATDMPVWGDAFKKPEEKYSAKKAQEKIGYVLEFMESFQVREKPNLPSG